MKLVVDAICVARGERTVIDHLSVAVAAGEVLAVTGPNGAGKSTLLRAIAGLLPLASGAIHFQETDLDEPPMHYVGHRNGLKLAMSVRANAMFWLNWFANGVGGDETVEAALDAVGLLHLADVPAGHLSQGQRRRVALSRLLLAPRPLWLLDEPTAGLDAASQDTFASLLAAHVGGGGLVVAATHDPLRGAPSRPLALG